MASRRATARRTTAGPRHSSRRRARRSRAARRANSNPNPNPNPYPILTLIQPEPEPEPEPTPTLTLTMTLTPAPTLPRRRQRYAEGVIDNHFRYTCATTAGVAPSRSCPLCRTPTLLARTRLCRWRRRRAWRLCAASLLQGARDTGRYMEMEIQGDRERRDLQGARSQGYISLISPISLDLPLSLLPGARRRLLLRARRLATARPADARYGARRRLRGARLRLAARRADRAPRRRAVALVPTRTITRARARTRTRTRTCCPGCPAVPRPVQPLHLQRRRLALAQARLGGRGLYLPVPPYISLYLPVSRAGTPRRPRPTAPSPSSGRSGWRWAGVLRGATWWRTARSCLRWRCPSG